MPLNAYVAPSQAVADWQYLGDPAEAEPPPMRVWQHLPTGRVWAEVSKSLDTDLLLVEQVTQGVGVRGLWDAGSVIYQKLVRLHRQGPKVLLIGMQTVHRSSDPTVQPTVDQSFANSVLWSFAAHDADGGSSQQAPTPPAGGVFIDLADWSLRDASGSGLIGALARQSGGTFSGK